MRLSNYWQVRGANLDEPDSHFHSTAPAEVVPPLTGDGVRTNATPPADEFPVAAILQSLAPIVPLELINFVAVGGSMLPQVPVPTVMLLETIASVAACLGPVVDNITSVARVRVR
jgi:hypothetical protein